MTVRVGGNIIAGADKTKIQRNIGEIVQSTIPLTDAELHLLDGSVIRWKALSETEQEYLVEYRQYLLDYPEQELWWEEEPLTYEDWLVAHHPVIEDSKED